MVHSPRVGEPLAGIDRGAWVALASSEQTGLVGHVVPIGFDEYARILHPPTSASGQQTSWSKVAANTGRALHPQVQFNAIRQGSTMNSEPGATWEGTRPRTGSLDAAQLLAFCDILSQTSATAPLWLGVWDGWGNLPTSWRTAPTIKQNGRAYYLFTRLLAGVVEFSMSLAALGLEESQVWAAPVMQVGAEVGITSIRVQSPNQWWPDDHSWFVASEVDFDSTIVGGTETLIERIIVDERLEAVRVNPSSDLTAAGDHINTI